MHGKEQALAPALAELDLEVVVPRGLDTDAFGTFTGEVPREGALEAARAKARAALRLAPGATFAAASEGTFGPHPAVPFVTAGIEHVLLMHPASGVEVVGNDVTLETNAAADDVGSTADALAFAARVGFPGHAVVVRAPGPGGLVLAKGLQDEGALVDVVERALAAHGRAALEADMRAHVNPTRMRAIARAARDAVERWRSACPCCARPGFVVTASRPGLPCAACREATDLAVTVTLRCAGCEHHEERPRPDGLVEADAGSCPRCNP